VILSRPSIFSIALTRDWFDSCPFFDDPLFQFSPASAGLLQISRASASAASPGHSVPSKSHVQVALKSMTFSCRGFRGRVLRGGCLGVGGGVELKFIFTRRAVLISLNFGEAARFTDLSTNFEAAD
jgi:hypothetical protein